MSANPLPSGTSPILPNWSEGPVLKQNVGLYHQPTGYEGSYGANDGADGEFGRNQEYVPGAKALLPSGLEASDIHDGAPMGTTLASTVVVENCTSHAI